MDDYYVLAGVIGAAVATFGGLRVSTRKLEKFRGDDKGWAYADLVGCTFMIAYHQYARISPPCLVRLSIPTLQRVFEEKMSGHQWLGFNDFVAECLRVAFIRDLGSPLLLVDPPAAVQCRKR
ncbi:hypothetical protein PSACC_00883 [Paramicrosporidium saccamoebae]|uniref:Uncharacterized protein n=1 Tax=Paramicrosporidium saccamoebae TaxID=1246581 RepID=A0A2H9TNF5_9FUNG|nr:hypothetical protein PSACC_00883 [Paramicrosporidium saccamoebae]